jgi:signal transduction histidine kinase/CheY-like chemotaxis protein
VSPVGIAILEATLDYENVNPAYCMLLGRTANELLTGNDDALLQAIHSELERGDDREGYARIRRPDESDVDIHWQVSTEADIGFTTIMASDVTKDRTNERERERLLSSERAARTEAERSNRLKEEFLATLSHELRNPLNSILGWAAVLTNTPDLPEDISKGLEAIERNARLQATMITDLLDYAGITFGKSRVVSEMIDPYPILMAALDSLFDAANAQRVQIKTSFGNDSAAIEADPARLQQIVVNLLSNAIKFSNKDSVVELDARRAGDKFKVSVTDHGKGIRADFLPRIFERFSQQDATAARSHGGLGLGLAIVKHLVEIQGGTIEAVSDGEGRGARFAFELPVSARETTRIGPGVEQIDSSNLTGVVALVVDDDPDARELTTRVLTDAGAVVIEAVSAGEALERVVESRVDVLISDIGMAEQDGYALLNRLRELGYTSDRLPAIALTAFARMQDREDALAAGYQEHLVKPLEPTNLVRRVALLCRGA